MNIQKWCYTVRIYWIYQTEELLNVCEVQKINFEVIEEAKKYWCTEIANEVGECQNVAVLAYHLSLPEEDTYLWLKELIEYFGNIFALSGLSLIQQNSLLKLYRTVSF